jgi:dephospho-CoA kinase
MFPPPLLVMGGMGSGKSRFLSMLAERGAATADADRFGHIALTEARIKDRVARRWPSALVEGEIDRAILAQIVFSSHKELTELEKIMHPMIRSMIEEFVAGAARPAAVEVSVPQASPASFLRVVVDASDEVRRRRLLGRGMTADEIVRRSRYQLSRRGCLQLADLVVNNDRDERRLAVAVGRVWQWWQPESKARRSPADNHKR